MFVKENEKPWTFKEKECFQFIAEDLNYDFPDDSSAAIWASMINKVQKEEMIAGYEYNEAKEVYRDQEYAKDEYVEVAWIILDRYKDEMLVKKIIKKNKPSLKLNTNINF